MYQHPAVQEACIIGAKDAHRGETVKAVIVPRAEWRGKIDAQAIIDWCRRAHGGLQGAAHHRIRRRAAQVRLRQDHVARTAGSAKMRRQVHKRQPHYESTTQPAARRLPETLMLEDIPDPVAGPRPGTHRCACSGRQFPGSAHHSGSVSNQAAAALLARRRTGRRGRRPWARALRNLKTRRSRSRQSGAQRHGGEGHRRRPNNCWKIPDDHALRRSRGAADDLWHIATRIEGSRTACAPARLCWCWARPAAWVWPPWNWARPIGARVIAAASSPEKLALAREHGADEGVQYPVGPLDKNAARALTDSFKAACGAAWGACHLRRHRRRLQRGRAARHRLAGPASGGRIHRRHTEAAAQSAAAQGLRDCGRVLGRIHDTAFPRMHAANVAALMALYLDGKIKPAVTERYSAGAGRRGDCALGLALRRAAKLSSRLRRPQRKHTWILNTLRKKRNFAAKCERFLMPNCPRTSAPSCSWEGTSPRTTWCAGRKSCSAKAGARPIGRWNSAARAGTSCSSIFSRKSAPRPVRRGRILSR